MKKKKKEMFPPFCVHWYNRSYTDFPICSEWFDSFESAISCALDNYSGYLFRIGYWDSPQLGKRCFCLEAFDVQTFLFKEDYRKHIVDICGVKK